MAKKVEIEEVKEKANELYEETGVYKFWNRAIALSFAVAFITAMAILAPMILIYGGNNEYEYRTDGIEITAKRVPHSIEVNGDRIGGEFIKITRGPEVPMGLVIGQIIIVVMAVAFVGGTWGREHTKRVEYVNDFTQYWAEHDRTMPPKNWDKKAVVENEGKGEKATT